ncbi:DUF488 domain-containing protein [Aminivibrio sp.]
MDIRIKRVYEPAEEEDGCRILVDRLWPRGLTKEKVKADLWLKEAAPSTELRKEFHHDPEKFGEFKKKYRAELEEKPDLLKTLLEECGKGRITLLYGAKDEKNNQAVVLRDWLLSRPGSKK